MKGSRLLVHGIGLFAILIVLSACRNVLGGVSVSEVWARPGLADGNSAVFFVIENSTETEDRLISAHSEVAKAVELHKSSMEDGKMKMEMQEFVPVIGGETVVFKPGDFHVMLIGLHDDLAVGDHVTVTLQFESAGEIVLDVVVREP